MRKFKENIMLDRFVLVVPASLIAFAAVLGVGLPSCAAAPNAPPAARAAVYPFAMCSNGNFENNPDYPVKLLDAGARMVRLDFGFPLVRSQPGDDPATWNWKECDKIRDVLTLHPDLQALAILGYGTKWAEDPRFKDLPGGIPSSPESGIDVRPVNDPKNVYGSFVYETVKRYKDVIHCWEAWNEPDLPGHGFFKGNGQDFLAYQRVCYLAAKEADPKCTVVLGAMCYGAVEGYLAAHKLKVPSAYPPATSFLEEYLGACAKDPDAAKNNFYFDAMNQHSYSRASDLYDYVAIDRKAMADSIKVDKPVWITEMGIPDKPGPFGCNSDEYCDYVLQSYAWGSLSGVQRFFHFQLDNSNGHGLYTGMLNDPKPVLTTYRDVLVKEFADASLVGQLHGTKGVDFLDGGSPFAEGWQSGYNLFEFRSRDGKKRIFMAFTDTDKPVTVKVPATKGKSAVLIDRHNVRTPLKAVDGEYTLSLAGATNVGGWPTLDDPKAKALGQPEHLVGGASQIIVEQ